MDTIEYYNKNAQEYFNSTVGADMDDQHEVFMKFVKRAGRILDFGCGSGRDAKFFKEKGYDVVALDGSEEMCKLARAYTGLDVRCERFEDFHDIDCYDGIWACSSLVHVEPENVLDMLKRLRDALVEDGHIFIAVKRGYGEEITEEGRYYNYLDFSDMENLIKDSDLKSEYVYMYKNDREHKYWSNFILKRK